MRHPLPRLSGLRAIPRRLRPRMAPESPRDAGRHPPQAPGQPPGPEAARPRARRSRRGLWPRASSSPTCRLWPANSEPMPRRCASCSPLMPKHRRHTASVTASSMPATMFFSTPRPGATAPWRFHRPIRGSNTVTCWRTITVSGAARPTMKPTTCSSSEAPMSFPCPSCRSISPIPITAIRTSTPISLMPTCWASGLTPCWGRPKFSSTNNISIRDACRWRMTRRWTTWPDTCAARPKPPVRWPWAGLTGRPISRGAFPPKPTLPGRHAAR